MIRIAIVDDEPWIVKGISKSCDWNVYDSIVVIEETDPEEAIARIIREKPHIVLTDINMGSISGIDLMEKVRIAGVLCEFVIISGYDEFVYAQKAMELGASYYLLKPLKKEELSQVIDKLTKKIKTNLMKADYSQENTHVISYDEDSLQGSHRFISMRQYVEEHYLEPLTLKDLAEKYHYHFTYVSELFRKNLGQSFIGYVTLLRMKKAKALLKKTDLSVTEVAAASGYEDSSHFSKTFKKMTGVSPSDYKSLDNAKE